MIDMEVGSCYWFVTILATRRHDLEYDSDLLWVELKCNTSSVLFGFFTGHPKILCFPSFTLNKYYPVCQLHHPGFLTLDIVPRDK